MKKRGGWHVCLGCDEIITGDAIIIRIDDGRKPGTPYRWREVGRSHDREKCKRDAYVYANKYLSNTIEGDLNRVRKMIKDNRK